MATFTATVYWRRDGAAFLDNRYSRKHEWTFDGGVRVAASASPDVVPLPLSVAEAVDPEEAFVASLSSCHMLWFLSIAAKRGFRVDSYVDEAVGEMGTNEAGRLAVTKVTLRPKTVFSGERIPSAEELTAVHHAAHEACFIANSVKTQVLCEL
ncbi:MAG TPA: OsmC family protein [Opitutaceae bacterium]|nr:OsmC family protein [Opitutaceae bacterium]